MIKMAQYEKNHRVKDKRITDYFIEDYVYVNNFKTRLGITLVTIFFMGVGAFRILMKDIIIPTSMWEFISVYIKPYFYPWVIAIIVYTIISTKVYNVKYKKANRGLNAYKKHVKQLKQYYEKTHFNSEGAPDEI